jgi:7-carboxy-7-deazaguanine synthase
MNSLGTTNVRVAEVFHSIQGEGVFAGTPSVFVRTTGCNLRCWFCDTPYTSWRPEGEQRTWESVFEQIRGFACEHVVLTGGEPLLQPEMVPLTEALRHAGHFVTVETAGTVFRPVRADLLSLSPKLANSTPKHSRWTARHEQQRHCEAILPRLVETADDYQLKFVVDSPEDLAEVGEFLSRFSEIPPYRIWLMPQGITTDELLQKAVWLEPAAEERGYRFCPRRHIELYGNVRGR